MSSSGAAGPEPGTPSEAPRPAAGASGADSGVLDATGLKQRSQCGPPTPSRRAESTCSSGVSLAHAATRLAQRGWKAHPRAQGKVSVGDPGIGRSGWPREASSRGTEPSSPAV